jgi:inner membrane protein
MATDYTHAVVGLGLARLYAIKPMPWAYWGLAAILPIVPDFDVFSPAAYGTLLGHRGFTHSLAFALVLGVVAAGLTFRRFQVTWWSLAGLFFLMVASHGLLDALTRGGADVPLFWPLSKCYGNWGLLPLSDIALDWPNPWSSRALRAELLWVWLPTGLLVALVMIYRRLKRKAFEG